MVVTETYFRNTHSVASVTEPDSTWSPYDGHYISDNEDVEVPMSISECLINFSEVVDKARH